MARVSQRLPAPSKAYYMGAGKLDELATLSASTPYDVVITDDELTPLQQHNLEDRLKVKIVDRVTLILDIFAARASTREGRLQVELAQQIYRYPRLAGQWQHLERLGAGIGTRGPGESQLETDRRLVRERIHRLEQQIEDVRKHRDLYRQRRKRNAVPVAAIVGYTNAGKSTLFNAISQASVLAEDKVFATLDPTTRRVRLPEGGQMLLTDTVGFIHKLPTTIVTAFRATLEELEEATVLVHVVDISSSYALQQSKVVEETLSQLGLANKPRVTVLNKADLILPSEGLLDSVGHAKVLTDSTVAASEEAILVSAVKKWGIDQLLAAIAEIVARPTPLAASDAQNGPSQP